MVGKAWCQEQKAAGHIASNSEEVGRDDCSFPGILGHGAVPLTFRMPLYSPVTAV